MQRFAAGSLFKRTVFQYIAEDLAADPGTNTAMFCLIDSQARPVVTMPSDSPLQNLLSSLDLEDNEAVDRHRISEGLQRLGGRLSDIPCWVQYNEVAGGPLSTCCALVALRVGLCMALLVQHPLYVAKG